MYDVLNLYICNVIHFFLLIIDIYFVFAIRYLMHLLQSISIKKQKHEIAVCYLLMPAPVNERYTDNLSSKYCP